MDRILNYFRTFPELFPYGGVFLTAFHQFESGSRTLRGYFGKVFFLYFGILVVLLSFLLLFSYQAYRSISLEQRVVFDELSYWESVASEHTDFPDAYYNAAYFAARLGNKHLALKYIEEALYLDEDFEEALALREEILSI